MEYGSGPAIQGSEFGVHVDGSRSDIERERSAEPGGGDRFADVGNRVAAILKAAEDAAEAIRSEAGAQVEDRLRRAEGEAAAHIQQLSSEATRLRGEAEDYASDIRLAVDSYAEQHRREAEEEGRAIVAEAESQARAMRETAEDMARQIAGDAQRRAEELRQELRLLEDRRERALQSLRDVAAQLEDVLVRPRAPEPGGGQEAGEAAELHSTALDDRG